MKPKQYQQGYVEFYKLKFKVTPDVLIPRPETELLVDEILNCIKYYVSSIKGSEILVLDVGTGAGNIAISLACNLEGCNVNIIATDISKKALEVARQNAKLHRVEKQITFIKGDLLSHPELTSGSIWIPDPIRQAQGKQVRDNNLIIIANLPYIPSSRIPTLDSSVKDFEPHIALDGGPDGFDLYRKLFKQITSIACLKLIVCEIDYTHESIAKKEALKYFPGYKIEIKKDLAKKIRILKISSLVQ